MCVCDSVCVCVWSRRQLIYLLVWFLVETGQGHTGNEPNKTLLTPATSNVDTRADKQTWKPTSTQNPFSSYFMLFMCVWILIPQVSKK